MGFDKKWYGANEHSAGDGPTEFSWGEGLVPPGYEHAPPSEGGMYIGRSPDMTESRRKPRRGDPPRGYPGDQIAM
jgi:hypothetical protein